MNKNIFQIEIIFTAIITALSRKFLHIIFTHNFYVQVLHIFYKQFLTHTGAFMHKNRIIKKIAFASLVFASLFSTNLLAKEIRLTDIAGREVVLKHQPQRIVLGEGRMMYAISVISANNPFKKVIAWNEDLMKYDPDAFVKFQKAFPKDVKRLINLGNPYAGDFSLESVIANKADLVILDVGNLFKSQESGLQKKLAKAGIPLVFIDFRRNATENTVPSLLILGRLFGEEQRTSEFLDFYIQQMRKVTNVVDRIPNEEKPLVFVENAAGGFGSDCCTTYGSFNYGRFVELAGGRNYGSEKFTGFSTKVSLEAVIAAKPDQIVATGANWKKTNPETAAVLLGYDGNNRENAKRVKALAQRSGFKELDAVKKGNYHAIYHQFYNSPYHFIAIQRLAKWFYPDRFKDLDPQATFEELHKRFLPFKYSGQFWISAEAKK